MRVSVVVLVVVVAFGMGYELRARESGRGKKETKMKLGAFSVSLAVKDIRASKAFYEKLGFGAVHGDLEQNWIILQNGTTTIGLFQGMFPRTPSPSTRDGLTR